MELYKNNFNGLDEMKIWSDDAKKIDSNLKDYEPELAKLPASDILIQDSYTTAAKLLEELLIPAKFVIKSESETTGVSVASEFQLDQPIPISVLTVEQPQNELTTQNLESKQVKSEAEPIMHKIYDDGTENVLSQKEIIEKETTIIPTLEKKPVVKRLSISMFFVNEDTIKSNLETNSNLGKMEFDQKLVNIVKKHRISIQNANCLFGCGVDRVFQFLQDGASELRGGRLRCLYQAFLELRRDSRFSQDGILNSAGKDLALYLESEAKKLNKLLGTWMIDNETTELSSFYTM